MKIVVEQYLPKVFINLAGKNPAAKKGTYQYKTLGSYTIIEATPQEVHNDIGVRLASLTIPALLERGSPIIVTVRYSDQSTDYKLKHFSARSLYGANFDDVYKLLTENIEIFLNA